MHWNAALFSEFTPQSLKRLIHDAFMIWEKQQQLLDLLGWEVTSISRDFYTSCEWQLLRFCGKLWVLTYSLSFFLQLLRQFRSDRCSRLPAHRAGHSANSSEDHRDCRNPLHLQEPALQVRLIGVLFMHLKVQRVIQSLSLTVRVLQLLSFSLIHES